MTESASTALIIATISCAFSVVNYLLFFLAIHVHFKLVKRVQDIEDRERWGAKP